MKLEEAIKQKKFSTPYEKAIINLLYTASWLDAVTIKQLKPFGLSPQQYNVLRILRGSHPNPIRLADITDRMIDKNSNATRLVEKLRQKAWLKREICPNNRRQVDIMITGKGLSLLADIDKVAPEWQKLLHGISEQEVNALNDMLDKIREQNN